MVSSSNKERFKSVRHLPPHGIVVRFAGERAISWMVFPEVISTMGHTETKRSCGDKPGGYMRMRKQKIRVSRRRHAQIHLPPLDPDQAVVLVNILEKAIEAVWRAHGDAMADYLGRVAPDSMPRPPDAVWSGRELGREDDLDF